MSDHPSRAPSVLITDAGFAPAPHAVPPLWQAAPPAGRAVFLANSLPAEDIWPHFDALDEIWIDFPGFADGRGFTLGQRLRALGYAGRLYAFGHVISEQYAMCRRLGFDGVIIDADLAARQPEAQWRARAQNWAAHHYQARLRA